LGESLVSKEKIAELLQQLHIELADADDLDAETSAQLRAASTEIRDALEREEPVQWVNSDSREEEPSTVIDQLRGAAERFEDSHPTLTNTVGRIADALAQLGI